MSAKLSLGWDVTVAVNGDVPISGRMFFCFNTTWLQASSPGYNTLQSDHDILLTAIIQYLTGKASGAAVLIMYSDPIGINDAFGSHFQSALTRLGHTFQLTGYPTFNGFDPLDYDFVCCEFVGESDANIDAYLDADGKIFAVSNVSEPLTFARYGITHSGYQSPTNAPLSFYCSAIGSALYTTANFWGLEGATATKTRPGTTTFYNNTGGEKTVATWEL